MDFLIRGLDKGGAAGRPQMVKQFFFAQIHALLSTKPLQMRQTNVGDVTVAGKGHLSQGLNFFLVVGTHFNHNEFWMGRGIEQGQRHADVVVEVPCRGMNLERCGQDISDEFLGGGFAIAAGHGKHGTGPCVSVGQGKLLQCVERVSLTTVTSEWPSQAVSEVIAWTAPASSACSTKALPSKLAPLNGDVNVVLEINTGVDGYAFGPRSYLEQVFHGF